VEHENNVRESKARHDSRTKIVQKLTRSHRFGQFRQSHVLSSPAGGTLVVHFLFLGYSLVIPWLFLGYYLSFLPYSFPYLIFHQSLAVGNYYYFQVLRILDG